MAANPSGRRFGEGWFNGIAGVDYPELNVCGL
jgi:hypothetical protein